MMTYTCSALEAILFAAGEPVPVSRLSHMLGISEDEILETADELSEILKKEQHSIVLVRLADKLQLCSSPEFANVIVKILEQRRPPSLSPAALETLAVVAYYQPATAAYISRVRGVDSAYSVSSLVCFCAPCKSATSQSFRLCLKLPPPKVLRSCSRPSMLCSKTVRAGEKTPMCRIKQRAYPCREKMRWYCCSPSKS